MGTISVSAPAAQGTVTRGLSIRNNAHTEGPASEYLVSISVPKGVPAGVNLVDYIFNPILLLNSRLRAVGSIYGQYRFRSLWIDMLPACATTTDGSICAALDKNLSFNPNDNSLGYAMGVDASSTQPLWERVHLTADTKLQSSRQRLYLTDPTGDLDENTQFRLLIVSAAPILSALGGASIILKMGYVVEFNQAVNSGVDSTPVGKSFTLPAGITTGAAAKINGEGLFTWPTDSTALLPSGLSNHGIVFAVNPIITAAMGTDGTNPNATAGIVAGSEPCAAVIIQTKADGTQPFVMAYSSVQAALSASAFTFNKGAGDSTLVFGGDVYGTNSSFGFACPTNFIPVGRLPVPFHV